MQKRVKDLYSISFPNAQIMISNHMESELSKYFINCFLAVKVSFANEIYSLCQELNIDYDEVLRLVSLENRVGNSHLSVPGPDGKKGFGGSCFPKDINSLINLFEKSKVESHVLSAAWKRNSTIDRSEKDWEKLKGRAVSEERLIKSQFLIYNITDKIEQIVPYIKQSFDEKNFGYIT